MKNFSGSPFLEGVKDVTTSKYKLEKCDISDKNCVSGSVGVFAGAMLVFFMVATIVFSLYVFVHISGISDLAGVHVTSSIKSAIDEVKNGKQEVGYEGWLTYDNDDFMLKYPGDWKLQELQDGTHIVSLKNYTNADRNGFESLTESVYVDVSEINESLSIKEVLESRGIEWNNAWKKEFIGGKIASRTGKVKTDSGVIKDIIFWEVDNNKIYLIEADYLNENPSDLEDSFNKIIAGFKFK